MRKAFYLIPLFLIELMIQLTLFWLMPPVNCRWVAYGIITFMSVTHLAFVFVLSVKRGVRRSMGTIIVSSFIMMLVLGGGSVLMLLDASVRNVAFSLTVLCILYAVVVSTLFLTMDSDSDLATSMPPGDMHRLEGQKPCMADADAVFLPNTNDTHTRMNGHCEDVRQQDRMRAGAPPLPVRL